MHRKDAHLQAGDVQEILNQAVDALGGPLHGQEVFAAFFRAGVQGEEEAGGGNDGSHGVSQIVRDHG